PLGRRRPAAMGRTETVGPLRATYAAAFDPAPRAALRRAVRAARPPADREIALGLWTDGGERGERTWVLVRDADPLDARHIERAEASTDADGRPIVSVVFDAAGAERLEALTGALVGKRLAIVLGDEVVSAPLVHEKIACGRVM